MDRISKRRFLIDTGSDLCVYRRKLIPRRREHVNYDLCAANGTTIPTYGWLSLNLNLGLRRNFTWQFVVADVTQPLIGVDFLSHFGLLVDCKHNRLLGRHSCFIPVSRGTRTTSMVSTRPASEVWDPHPPGERNHPSIQYHLPRLQNLRRGFPAAGRMNNLSTGLPSSQDRQSPLTFSRHVELLQAISAPRGSTLGTTSRHPLRTQSQGLPPHHLDTGAPQGLRKVQGEFVMRHSTGTPRHIHTTCTRHRRLHDRPRCHAVATR
jgi:hypothetical protein